MTLPGYEIPGKKYDLTYIALGAGVQSSALLLMSNLGLYDVPRADVAIFADTGAEPPDVYRVLDELEKASSIPVVRVGDANLEDEFIQGAVHGEGRFVNLPLYLEGGGLLRRGCTAEKKVKPILLYIKRQMLGLKPRISGAICLIHSWITASAVRSAGRSWRSTARAQRGRKRSGGRPASGVRSIRIASGKR